MTPSIPNPYSQLTRNSKLEAPDRLEHWQLKASRSLDSIVEDAAAADPKALSHQASAPLKHLELRNPGSVLLGGGDFLLHGVVVREGFDRLGGAGGFFGYGSGEAVGVVQNVEIAGVGIEAAVGAVRNPFQPVCAGSGRLSDGRC